VAHGLGCRCSQGETGFLKFVPGPEGVCPAFSVSPKGGFGVAVNVGQEPFRYEPFFRTAGGTLVVKAKDGSATPSKPPPPGVFPSEG
jgi:hypothetical protein